MTNTITKITYDGEDYEVGGGDVVGPASATDLDIALFDGVTGKIIKDSGVKLSDKLDASALSDTNYGGAWSGDTTHTPTKNAIYTKLHTMDVEIGNKAADNTVVKLSGNQTIGGTKTFSTSPVVPSKTTDATNDGTAIATEAQVYKKAEIEYVTQAEYTALLPGAESDGKHYFIYTPSVVPPSPGWQPGVNTKAYYKINDNDTNTTIYDLSGNGIDQTWSGTATYTTDATYGRVAVFDGASQTSASSIVDFGGEITLLVLVKASSLPGVVISEGASSSRRPSVNIALRSDSYGIACQYSGTGTLYEVLGSSALSTNTWYMIATTRDSSGNIKLYINGTLINTVSSVPVPNYSAGDNLMIGKRYGEAYLNGQFKLFIGEDRTRTDQEIADLATEYGFTVS